MPPLTQSPARHQIAIIQIATIMFGDSLTEVGISRAPQDEVGGSQCRSYPRTLILENDSTARDEIGRPIDIAGRNVVKINILFTWGSNACDSPGSERIL